MIEIDVDKTLGDFSLAVRISTESGVTALFGPSGAGKTTLLNLIAGLTKPDRGCIEIGGVRLFDSKASINVPVHARAVGYVFQDLRLFPHMNVARNLDYGRFMSGRRQDLAQMTRLVDLLDLAPLLTRRPQTLSGGEAARVAIARALLSEPRLLLLDEPLASLDQARKSDILPYLKLVAGGAGVPIIYVSHAEAEVRALARRIIHIERGRVVASEG